MTIPTLNSQLFRASFPQFTSGCKYSDSALQAAWSMALCFINGNQTWCCQAGNQQVLNLMTAHIALLMGNAAIGEINGILTAATIEKVTVQLQPPPERSQWQWWLNQTPYGQQLLALFQIKTVGGYYVGGSLDLAAFRRPGRVC